MGKNAIYYDRYFLTTSFYLVIAHEITHVLATCQNKLTKKLVEKLDKKKAELKDLTSVLIRLKKI